MSTLMERAVKISNGKWLENSEIPDGFKSHMPAYVLYNPKIKAFVIGLSYFYYVNKQNPGYNTVAQAQAFKMKPAKFIKFLKNNFNGFEGDSYRNIYYKTEEDTMKALEYFESLIMFHKMTKGDDDNIPF